MDAHGHLAWGLRPCLTVFLDEWGLLSQEGVFAFFLQTIISWTFTLELWENVAAMVKKEISVDSVTHFANPTVDHNLFLKRFCDVSVNMMTARTPWWSRTSLSPWQHSYVRWFLLGLCGAHQRKTPLRIRRKRKIYRKTSKTQSLELDGDKVQHQFLNINVSSMRVH